jgi:hypothetical protein
LNRNSTKEDIRDLSIIALLDAGKLRKNQLSKFISDPEVSILKNWWVTMNGDFKSLIYVACGAIGSLVLIFFVMGLGGYILTFV